MSKLKTYLRRFRFRMRHDFLTVENVVLVLAIVLCLAWTYSSITAMTRNWELSERLVTEKKTLELLAVEVEAAELENDYFRSEEYQELMARKYLDKRLPGENLVILPENSDTARAKHQVSNTPTSDSSPDKDKERSNFERWMMFLFPSF